MNSTHTFNSTEEIIEAYKNGKMVIMLDDEHRENEGDLMMASETITPEAINFMITYGRGLICLTLTKERCQQLKLPLMVEHKNLESQKTNFTLSIDAAKHITTGISAADRARTIAVAVAPHASTQDIVQPGHIFPIQANEHGVLQRAGHTEAGCDLARLAGLTPSSAIVEILNPDGSMARKDQLMQFAAQHGLLIGTIADLIAYRIQHETSVEHLQKRPISTEYGDFILHSFLDKVTKNIHLALVKGTVVAQQPTLVRVHVRETLSDLFQTGHIFRNISLQQSLRTIAKNSPAILVILDQGDAEKLLERIEAMPMRPGQTSEHPQIFEDSDSRSYGIGAQILKILGAQQIKILGKKRKFNALSGFNLEIMGYQDP